MTRKLPFQMAASGRSSSERGAGDGSEDPGTEIVVDRSDDVTVEAQEDITTEAPAAREAALEFDVDDDEPVDEPVATPAPLILDGSEPRVSTQTLLGMLAPSLPLPGVTAPASHDGLSDRPQDDVHELDDFDEAGNEEVTVLANPVDPLASLDRFDQELARPSVTDDDEEETKVEPAATAAHAAASRDDEDDVLTALSEQASVEREKALRKSSVFGSQNLSGRGVNDLEFADPDEDEEAAVMGSADLVAADDDDDDDGESAGTYPKSVDPSPMAAAFTARRLGSPPLGTAFGTRLPTPSPGFAGLSLSSPAQAPAPGNSPFGRLAAVPAGSPYGGRAGTGAMAALQIPAPSGSSAATAGVSPLFKKVQVPAVAFVTFIVAAAGIGFFVGASLYSGSAAPTVTVAPAQKPHVAQPTPSGSGSEPAAPSTGTTTTTAGTTVKTTAPGEVAPTPLPNAGPSIDPIATAGATETTPAPKPLKRARPKKAVSPDAEDEEAAAPAAKPAPKPQAKPAKPAKPSKVWVDPFAQ